MYKHVLPGLFVVVLLTFVFAFQPSVVTANPLASFTKNHRLSPRSNIADSCLSSAHGIIFPDPVRWSVDSFPTLSEFVKSTMNSDPDAVTGVYVCRLLALRIIQQPDNDPVYVSSELGTATQFRLAAGYGTVGLLAHNDQSGAQFFDLAKGNEVDVVRGDGTIQRSRVSSIRHLQPIIADNPYSDFYDLDTPADPLSSTQVFRQIFANGDQVVFQTCISANGNPIWGRLFVIATPMSMN